MPTAAFDMLGTFFSLESLRPRLTVLGAPPHALEVWFAGSLRDFFATSLAGGYEPLASLLASALPRTFAELGLDVPAEEKLAQVREGLKSLEPAPGAAQAVEALAREGWTLVALTNGAETSTRALLEKAGLLERFAAVLSTDTVRVSKPHGSVYALARNVSQGDLWMVAAHGWDLLGARRAGLRTAWVSRKEKRWLEPWPAPDVQAEDLAGVARELVASVRTGAPPFRPLG